LYAAADGRQVTQFSDGGAIRLQDEVLDVSREHF